MTPSQAEGWKCAGCGAPGLEQSCDCVTDVVCRVTATTHDHAVKTPRSKRYSYDSKCEDLAGEFLGDVDGIAKVPTAEFDRLRSELAQHIQDAIEDWLGYDLRKEWPAGVGS